MKPQNQRLADMSAVVEALNIALAELREVSETSGMNCFDSVMRMLGPEVRAYIRVDTSPVYWSENASELDYYRSQIKFVRAQYKKDI